MNGIVKPKSSEESIPKCPVWKITRFFNDLFKNILSKEDKKTELLNKVSNIALEELEKIDFNEEIEADYELRSEVNSWTMINFFDVILKKIIWDIELSLVEANILMNILKGRDETQSDKEYFWGLLGIAIMDIFTTLMLHKNFWFSVSECKKILDLDMLWEKQSDMSWILSPRISAIIRGNYCNENEILTEIMKPYEKYRNITNNEWSCPFLKSKYKAEWINEIWNLLDDKVLPVIQEKCSIAFKTDAEWLFYLGKYNKIEKW